MENALLPPGQSHADKVRAAGLKWRGMPPGIPPAMAVEFMEKLKAGSTITKLVSGMKRYGPAMVSRERFSKHCQLYPEWGVDAQRLSNANANLLKSNNHVSRKATMCRNGLHPLEGSNLGWRRRDPSRPEYKGTRYCIACAQATWARAATPLTAAEKARIKEAFAANNLTLSQIMHGKPVGGGSINPKLIIASPRDIYHARATDPDFDRFITAAISGSGTLGQQLRHAKARARIARAKNQQDAKDYFEIAAMIPRWFPEQDKFDVVNDVMAELSAGKITRDQLSARIKFYMAEANKMFAPKFRKFGDAKMVSLDELAFDDGSTTIGENVIRGLWD